MFGKKTQNTALAPRPELGATRWTPWDEIADMRRQMDEMFGRSFGYTPLAQLIPGDGFNYEPSVDIYTTDDKIIVFTALPGFRPEDIDIEAAPDTLTIQGERKALLDGDKAIAEQQNGVVAQRKFRIQFSLPAEIDTKKVTSTLSNGVLQLEMLKTEVAKNKSVKVAVKTP